MPSSNPEVGDHREPVPGKEKILSGIRLRYLLVILFLAALTLLFQCLVLSGIPVNSAAYFYVFESNGTRVGYTGMCTSNSTCFQSAGSSAASLTTKDGTLDESTFLELLALQSSLSFAVPVTVTVAIGIGLLLLTGLWIYRHQDEKANRKAKENADKDITEVYREIEEKRKKSRPVLLIIVLLATAAFWIATAMAFVSAYSAQVFVDGLIITSTPKNPVRRGGLVHAFLWIILVTTLLLALLVQIVIFPGALPEKEEEDGRRQNEYGDESAVGGFVVSPGIGVSGQNSSASSGRSNPSTKRNQSRTRNVSTENDPYGTEDAAINKALSITRSKAPSEANISSIRASQESGRSKISGSATNPTEQAEVRRDSPGTQEEDYHFTNSGPGDNNVDGTANDDDFQNNLPGEITNQLGTSGNPDHQAKQTGDGFW